MAEIRLTLHRIYEACGFRDYNGHVMRYLRGDRDWHDFDGQYFADSGTAVVRAGHWGDLARVGMLYAAPHPWFVKDYPERLYCSPAIVQRRVGSILPAMMLNASEKNGGLWVLENSAQRVVGAATVARLDQTAQRHAPILDFLVAPAYVCQAPDLISAAVAALRGSDATMVRACLASCDGEKADIVRLAGFQLDARLPGQFVAGQDHFDLHIYARSVP